MGRYIGPKSKIARKFGEAIFGADRVLEKRNFPPGQHGLARKRKKVSEYGQQLSEKQKPPISSKIVFFIVCSTFLIVLYS